MAIIEYFDVVEDLGASLVPGGEFPPIDQIQLEGTPEALHDGIVVAVAATAHGGDQIRVGEGLTEVSGGVLDTAIRMEEQVPRRSTMKESIRHGNRI